MNASPSAVSMTKRPSAADMRSWALIMGSPRNESTHGTCVIMISPDGHDVQPREDETRMTRMGESARNAGRVRATVQSPFGSGLDRPRRAGRIACRPQDQRPEPVLRKCGPGLGDEVEAVRTRVG